MSPPVVAVIGSTGYVGKCLMPAFLEAVKDGRLKELRVLTAEAKLNSEQIKTYVALGAKAIPVDYLQTPTVTAALHGVDVAVSTLGTGEGIEEVKKTVLNALQAAEVKVYFPSEFGTNHYKIHHSHPEFDGKKKHFHQAQKKGLNPIRMLTSVIMESSFGKWFGLDCVSGVWTVVGNAEDVPCAFTSERDLGLFTLEAVLLAHSDITKCPDEIEVYSDIHTLKDCAKLFEKVSGREIRIEHVPLEEFNEDFKKTNEFEKLIMILFSEGAFDYTKATGNQLLNPDESVWSLKTIEEYAKETNGIPWKDFKG